MIGVEVLESADAHQDSVQARTEEGDRPIDQPLDVEREGVFDGSDTAGELEVGRKQRVDIRRTGIVDGDHKAHA